SRAMTRPGLSLALMAVVVGLLPSGADDPRLSMTKPIACRAIRGYEDYDALEEPAVTPDEKLLIYVRPQNHATEPVEGKPAFRAHLIEDVNIRRKGQKKVVLGREKVVELKFESPEPPVNLYLGTSLGLKGIPPGEYEADLILKDQLRP